MNRTVCESSIEGWTPGYMAAAGRWLVENPRLILPEPGRFTDDLHAKLWEPVWERESPHGFLVSAKAGGVIFFQAHRDYAFRSGVDAERGAALTKLGIILRLMNLFEYGLCLTSLDLGGRSETHVTISGGRLVCSGRGLQLGKTMTSHYAAAILAAKGNRTGMEKIVEAVERIIPLEALERAVNIWDSVLGADVPDAAGLVGLIHRACAAHQDLFFEQAVLTSWSVCEFLQSSMLLKHYEEEAREGGGVLSARRRRRLQRQKAEDVTAELAGLGRVSCQRKDELDALRRARNEWVHGGTHPSERKSSAAIELAADVLNLASGLQLPMPVPQVGTHMPI